MRSSTTAQFRRLLKQQPPSIRKSARKAYSLFVADPHHPGLHFKKVHGQEEIYSVRIDLNYRALGVRNGDDILWFWIGAHDEYERIIADLS